MSGVWSIVAGPGLRTITPQSFNVALLNVHMPAPTACSSRVLEETCDAVDGEGWAVWLQALDEAVMVSRRQLPSVRDPMLERGRR